MIDDVEEMRIGAFHRLATLGMGLAVAAAFAFPPPPAPYHTPRRRHRSPSYTKKGLGRMHRSGKPRRPLAARKTETTE